MRLWNTQLNGEIKWGCGYELNSFYGTGKELTERDNKPTMGKREAADRQKGRQCEQKKQSFVEADCYLPSGWEGNPLLRVHQGALG